jgi:hypothetical protein
MGHFYLPDGTPFYQVPYAGKRIGMRDATLRDARKVGAYPSVTAIINVLDKPGLTNWKINQAILAALTNPHITPDMSSEEVVKLIKRDSMEQGKQAAEEGTRIHDAIEASFQEVRIGPQYEVVVDTVRDLIDRECGDQDWEAEKWFASPLGYGGKIDLISDQWVIDFKTKDGPADDHSMWPDQAMQLVAYEMGAPWPEPTVPRKLANVIVSRTDGSVKFWLWDDQEFLERQWRCFRALLTYWQTANQYFPHEVTQ